MVGVPDFCVSFAASIARDLVHGAIREARYCCCFNNFVEDLKKEKQELLNCEESIRERAKKARENAKKIEDEVQQWLAQADAYENEVDELVKRAEKSESCSPAHYPNWICRCLVARQLAKKKEDIRQHNEKTKNFKNFARLASLPRMGHFSSEHFMKFDSRKLVHEQLLKELKDEEVSMIGLYGMGGCGKTTLAKEVGKEAEQFFNKVVFVVVSRNEVRSIQNKIASWLEYKFDEEEETERAKRLSMLLSNNEKILIILDDVWGKLDFGAIGIPFGENRKGCKVLMTTRFLSVCDLMDCQKEIFLPLLSFEESLALFQKHAHIADDTFDALKDVAEEITEKCNGLPVAIAAIASTLKGKPRVKWDVALKTLKESRPMDIEEGLQNPYTCLQLSYENLKCQEVKSLFLLCSAFPEDMNIPVEILTRFGIGLGLFGKVSSYAMARKQVIAAKHELLNACLLLEDEDDKDNSVKMHDLVRDVALYLAKGEIKVIKGNDRNGNALEEDLSTLKGSRVRYLWCGKFPNRLSCSKLEFLCVHYESEIVEVPGRVFENLTKLQVLALTVDEDIGKIPQLPKSIEKLTNLRCLFLIGCELDQIPFLQSMKGLESLTLVGCTFLEFPDAIAHLKKLKLLHVIVCKIERSPYEVIGRCIQLEELYLTGNNCSEWSYADETAAKFLEKFNAPQALQRYQIEIGAGEEGSDILNILSGCILNTLVIEYFVASISNSILKDLVKRAEVLSLGHIKGDCKSIVPDVYQKVGGLSELIELELHNSEEIKYLIDKTERQCNAETVFSKLSKLRISQMHCLEALCHGLPSPVLFKKLEEICICECSQLHGVLFIGKLNLCNLQVLELDDCPKLTSIFTADSVQSLSQLQDVEIHGCSELKHIIREEVKEEIIECSDQRTKQLPFQKLKRLSVRRCEQLEYIVPVSYAHGLLQLESMEIIGVDGLKFLFGQHNHANQLVEHAKNDFQIKLPVLKLLRLSGLPNVVSIFPENYYPVWPSLDELYLNNCPKFAIMYLNMCVVESEVKQHCDPTKEMDPLLVRSNHKSDGISHVQNLVKLEIHRIGKIKSIFSTCSMESMPHLEHLSISSCNQLEQIIANEEHHNIMNTGIESCPKSTSNCYTFHSGSFHLCNLKQVELDDCPMLKSLFTLSTVKTLTSLENLSVSKCHVLKEIINCESSCGCRKEESGFQSHFSILFPKLKKLNIGKCDSLECIFPIPFNQGLMELKYISIWNAPQLQYLFGEGSLEHHSSHQYQNIIQIKLPVLEELTLEELPNLISICPSTYYTVCPSLRRIVLNHVGLSIPTSNILKGGSEDTQRDYTSTKDLGATIMKLVQNSDVENSNSDEHFIGKENDLLLLREMILWNQQEIMYLCISPKRLLNLQNLLQLRIEGCGRLKAMFSVSVLKSLPQLKVLMIIKCEELEQITIEEQENENMSNPYSQKGCFPQLEVLYIKCCNKLKLLFSISMFREFPKLECMIIKEASQLKEVFENEKDETEEMKEVVLPQLKYVILVQLPSLTNNVCQGIEFQTVTCRVVQNCPNLSLTTALQKSIEDLQNEIYGDFWPHYDLMEELGDILKSTTTETSNEDPMIESEVSDSKDEAVSRSEPPSSQMIEERGKGIIGNGFASRAPAMATSSTDAHGVTEEVQEDLPIKKANTMTSLTDLEPGSFTSLQKSSPQGVGDGVQESLSIEKANAVASSLQINIMEQQKSITSQERPQLISDAGGPNMVPATHVGAEDGEPVLDQPQQLISPPPVLSAASTPPDTVSSYQKQSITMPLSSGQTFEEPALPAPALIPKFELDPLDELESLLTDSSFSPSTNTAPFQSPSKRLSIQKMAEELDALFDKEVDDLYNDPAILERLAQISSISESITESDAPSTFVDFMKNFRSMYPQLLKDFEKNRKAMLEYEKVKTEKDNMAAEIPTIRGKKKELEDNIRRAEFVEKTFSDQIAELKRQLIEVESRAQAHKIVLSSLQQDRTKMDLNTRALIEKAKKITHFINSNSLVYTENRVNLASLRNGWTDLKSQFVQSRDGL